MAVKITTDSPGAFWGMIGGFLVVMALVFVLVLFIVRIVWAWTVPSLFPGAVEEGLIVASLTWLNALKIAILAAVLTGCGHSSGGKE